MNKLFILLLLSASSAFGYTYKFLNKTKVKIRVTLGTIAGPDYPVDINPGQEQTISTGGWCRRSIKIIALEKDSRYGSIIPFADNFFCVPILGTNCCSSHNYIIYQTIGSSGPKLGIMY